jgi:hypothetical protein
MSYAASQKASEGLDGRSAGDIKAMRLPGDNFHLRVRTSALILCEINEGAGWMYSSIDGKGRTMWKAATGKGLCNVDPTSKVIVRG